MGRLLLFFSSLSCCEFRCHYQHSWLREKTHLQYDVLCVSERSALLTHSHRLSYVMPYIKIRLMSPDIDNEIFIQLERGYLMLKNEL